MVISFFNSFFYFLVFCYAKRLRRFLCGGTVRSKRIYSKVLCGELLALWLVCCCWWERRSIFYLDGRNRKLVFFFLLDLTEKVESFFMEGFLVKFSLLRVGGERSIVCFFFYLC